jgi:hypothetical protein
MKDPALLTGVTENPSSKAFRFKRGLHGDQVYFSYANGKKREDALVVANAFATEYTAKHGPTPPSCVKGRMTKSNRSGKSGVHPKWNWNRLKDQKYWYWACVWPGVRSGPIFSLLKYNEDEAFVLASIACELETFDKEYIELEYERYKAAGMIESILSKKKITLPLDE